MHRASPSAAAPPVRLLPAATSQSDSTRERGEWVGDLTGLAGWERCLDRARVKTSSPIISFFQTFYFTGQKMFHLMMLRN